MAKSVPVVLIDSVARAAPSAVIRAATSAGVNGAGRVLMLMHAGNRNAATANKSGRRRTVIRDPRVCHQSAPGTARAGVITGDTGRAKSFRTPEQRHGG